MTKTHQTFSTAASIVCYTRERSFRDIVIFNYNIFKDFMHYLFNKTQLLVSINQIVSSFLK